MIVLPIFLICFLLQFFMPWWVIGIVAFGISAWQAKSGTEAFKCGFSAIFLLWLMMSLFRSVPNENILANRVGQMLMLPNWSLNWLLVALITSAVGGLAAGFAGLSGYLMKQVFVKNES